MRTGRVLLTLGLFTFGCGVDPGGGEVAETSETSQHVEGASSPTLWLTFPELSGITRIETARNADGSLALFAQPSSGGLRFARQATPNGGWWAPLSLGGGVNRDFAVGRNADGRLGVFALGGGDGAIYFQWQTWPNSGSWSGWQLMDGGGFTDITVGRHGNGRLAVFTVAADGTLRVRHQLVPGGGFLQEVNEGGALRRVEVGTTGTGRMIVFAVAIDGSIVVKEQTAPNGAFGDWISFGGTQIVDIDVGVDQDGRLELVAGLSGGYSYKRSQVAPDGGWNSWYYLGGQGLGDLDTVLAPDGRLHLFAISNERVHHVHQTSPGSEPWTWAPERGGSQLQAVRAERNEDGRLELFALTSAGEVLQTWQTAVAGGWLPLPAAPAITTFTVSTTRPQSGARVWWDWALTVPPGCTPTGKASVKYLETNTSNTNAFTGSAAGSWDFLVWQDTRVELTATCREHITSGFVTERFASILIVPVDPPPAPPPPPPPPMRVQAPTYQVWLGADVVYSGPRSHSIYWGYSINGGQLTSLVNPTPYFISLIRPSASNNDCWGSNAVTLAPGQATTAAELTRLYGSSTPGLPTWIRGCANVDTGGILQVNVNYSYLQ